MTSLANCQSPRASCAPHGQWVTCSIVLILMQGRSGPVQTQSPKITIDHLHPVPSLANLLAQSSKPNGPAMIPSSQDQNLPHAGSNSAAETDIR